MLRTKGLRLGVVKFESLGLGFLWWNQDYLGDPLRG